MRFPWQRAGVRPDTPAGAPSDRPTSQAADPGIRACAADALIEQHRGLVARLKLCYGAERSTFEAELLALVRNYAAYVNLLPATADNFFSCEGGLFRLGLETAFFALQGTDAHIVAGRATITARRQLEPRWRRATFVAGLCAELHRALSHVVVTDEQGAQWPSYLAPLTDWLEQRGSARFFVRWQAGVQESRALGLFALPHVVPPETLQYLAADNTTVVPQMLACLTGTVAWREQSILADLVRRSAALVIDRDLVASANRHGKPVLGAHLGRYFLDAMRKLVVSSAAWSPNHDRSRVWHAPDGLFVLWPNAAADVCKLLDDEELPGIPKDPETIADVLEHAGLVVAREDGTRLWSVVPLPGKAPHGALRLASPDLLLSPAGGDVAMLAAPIAVRVAPAAAPRPSGPGAGACDGAGSAAPHHPGTSAAPPAPVPSTSAPAAAAGGGLSSEDNDASASKPVDGPALPVASVPSSTVPPSADATKTTLEAVVSERVETPQLPLAFALAARDEPDGAAGEPDEAVPGPVPCVEPVLVRLEAPGRLSPAVREAVSQAIESLNGDPSAARASVVRTGVFIPLAHFQRFGVDSSTVLRSLGESGLIPAPAGRRPMAQRHKMDGEEQPGVVIKPRFVVGLDPAGFVARD